MGCYREWIEDPTFGRGDTDFMDFVLDATKSVKHADSVKAARAEFEAKAKPKKGPKT